MSHNSFGHLFRVTTWGESHGPAIGCVIDGCPSLIPLTEADIQPWLDQRKPGGSRFVTQRRESDTVRILSGTFDDGEGPVTTGTPISLMIENEDARSKDYGEIARAFRPGHADYVYQAKYGVRDHRGGGRSSARETALRVAAGAIARLILGPDVVIRAGLSQIGPHRIPAEALDFDAVQDNPLFAASREVVQPWSDYLDGVRKAGSSIGAVVALEVTQDQDDYRLRTSRAETTVIFSNRPDLAVEAELLSVTHNADGSGEAQVRVTARNLSINNASAVYVETVLPAGTTVSNASNDVI